MAEDYSIWIALWLNCRSHCSTCTNINTSIHIPYRCDDYIRIRSMFCCCRRVGFYGPCIQWEGARCYSFVCQYVMVLSAKASKANKFKSVICHLALMFFSAFSLTLSISPSLSLNLTVARARHRHSSNTTKSFEISHRKTHACGTTILDLIHTFHPAAYVGATSSLTEQKQRPMNEHMQLRFRFWACKWKAHN